MANVDSAQSSIQYKYLLPGLHRLDWLNILQVMLEIKYGTWPGTGSTI